MRGECEEVGWYRDVRDEGDIYKQEGGWVVVCHEV